MDHVTYWVGLAMLVALAVAYWGWKNMGAKAQSSALGILPRSCGFV